MPPGIPFLLSALPRLLGPPTLVYLASHLAQEYYALYIPRWGFVLACVLSFPAALTVSVTYRDIVNARDARANGAVMPPVVKDWTPGSIRNLKTVVDNFNHGYPGDMLEGWEEQYGHTLNFRVFFENRIFTTEPHYIKAILATQFDNFEKGPFFIHQCMSLLGTGVFNSDGDLWKFHRSITRPFFSKDRIAHFDIFERHADDAIQQIKARLSEGHAVDMQDAVARFTLDSATEFLFGQDVRSLSAGLPYPHNSPVAKSVNAAMANHASNQFAHSFLEGQRLTALRGRYGVMWPLREFWTDKTKQHVDVVSKFIDPILEEAVRKNKESGAGKIDASDSKADREVGEEDTLLDHMVNYTNDKKILKDEILNMMVAGRDTTAGTLSFAVYMLAEHPKVLKRLREEILTKIGGERRPTYDDFRDMKYLRAFINETLRLYPPVPFNIRTTNKATLWPSKTPGEKPFYIPAKTRVPYSVFLMHRRKDLWGPDATEFDPERFIDSRLQKYLTPNPFIFLPFNAGPRICLGQQFAYNEVSFFLVRLLQNFSGFAMAPESQPEESRPPAIWASQGGRKAVEKIWPKSHLTMYANDGVWMKLKQASPETA